MATDEQNVRDQLKSVLKEPMKLYRTFDGSNRLEYQYECATSTPDQGPCLKTQYVYDGGSDRIVKVKETIDVWDASFEV